MEERKITNLIESALTEDDYKFRINLLLASLFGGSDDSEEILIEKNEHLRTIKSWIDEGNYPQDKSEYFLKISQNISDYLSRADEYEQ